MSDQTVEQRPSEPDSVPWPVLIYAVGAERDGSYYPLVGSAVGFSRRDAESELVDIDVADAMVIEKTVLPWAPASSVGRPGLVEYTVGFGAAERTAEGQPAWAYTTWGLGISKDRGEIVDDLARVQRAIADAGRSPLSPLLLERPSLPWYPARPEPAAHK